MMTEQELIERYFHLPAGKGVLIGIGDDAAVVQSREKMVMSLDSLVVGAHFRQDDEPIDIGYKSLAVNLSDLAAMGASPRWAMLSLSLPDETEESWISGFAEGFMSLLKQWDMSLIGGDLVRGPLSVTVQVTGEVTAGTSLLRSGACEDDGIYMSGDIGNAGFAWHRSEQLLSDEQAARQCQQSLHHPVPRVAEGQILAQFATAAIDISDGLLLDLSRLLSASGKGGVLELDRVPLGEGVSALLQPEDWLLPLTAGDDYELLFTLADEYEDEMRSAIAEYGTPVTKIGYITGRNGLRCMRQGKEIILPAVLGFDHFSANAL